MEKIIINTLLYTCANGTNDKISKALKEGDKAPASKHENGTSHEKFNEILWNIIDTQNGEFIENVYQTT